MSTSKPIIVITAVIVDPKSDVDDQSELVQDAILEAIPEAIRDIPGAQFTKAFSVFRLDPEHSNCFQCENCGVWATNYEKPDEVGGICVGRLFEGMLVCDQCECRNYYPE